MKFSRIEAATGVPRGGGGSSRNWGHGGISPHQKIPEKFSLEKIYKKKFV
jgi:hypothetical protein